MSLNKQEVQRLSNSLITAGALLAKAFGSEAPATRSQQASAKPAGAQIALRRKLPAQSAPSGRALASNGKRYASPGRARQAEKMTAHWASRRAAKSSGARAH